MKRFFISLLSLFLAAPMWSITRQKFDFVVGRDGTWAQAKAAAEASNKSRFYIFFPNGSYDFGSTTGDGNQMTTFNKANVSLIGQSMDGVVCYNKAIQEAISTTATLSVTKGGLYFQDITLQNKGQVAAGSFAGRFVAFQDQGDKNILVRVKMLSTQDTYYSTKAARRTYLEDCEIHGTVDFICGGGDIFFNKCNIWLENRSNNVITAPAGSGKWGYVFSGCTIDGDGINEGGYRLGRPWNNLASSVFINTTMKKKPHASGWGDPMNVVPTKFAEYNSRDAYGNHIDLSKRRSFYDFTDKNGAYHSTTINPVMSAQEAAGYTVSNVCSGTDGWAPDKLAQQVSARMLSADGNELSWNHDDKALCYFIFANGVYVDHTIDNKYTVGNVNVNVTYTVRAANEMGGLGPESNGVKLQEEKVSENEHIFHFDNGVTSMREGTEYSNVWTCSDNGFEDFGWSITSRDDKAILYGNNISFRGKEYKTFKSSNGAQSTIKMPEGYKATKVTFIGYTNDASVSSVLSEIDGKSASMTMDAKVQSSGTLTTPSRIEYDFTDEPCNEFTFTFGTKQACFIIVLESEYCGCRKPGGTDTSLKVINVDFDEPRQIFNIYGQPVKEMKKGSIYIINGEKFIF